MLKRGNAEYFHALTLKNFVADIRKFFVAGLPVYMEFASVFLLIRAAAPIKQSSATFVKSVTDAFIPMNDLAPISAKPAIQA